MFFIFSFFQFFQIWLGAFLQDSYGNSYEYLKNNSYSDGVFEGLTATVSCVFTVKSGPGQASDRSHFEEFFQIFLCFYSKSMPKNI